MIYLLNVPDNFVNKHEVTVTLGWQDSNMCVPVIKVYIMPQVKHDVYVKITHGSALNTENSEIFARVLISRSFMKINPSRNCDITLSFTEVGTCNSRSSRNFFKSQKCLLTLFAKINSRENSRIYSISREVGQPQHSYIIHIT